MRGFLTFLLFLYGIQFAKAQELESIVFLDNYTRTEVGQIFGISVDYGVDLYKVRYFTDDIEGNQSIASGLLCVPEDENLIFPLAAYQHGTVSGRSDVPSRLAGGFQLPLVLASFGYVVCAPDMLGLGDSPGIHLYIHAETQATAAIDMLSAIRDNDESRDEYAINDQLFIAGYSQGGHAAMALHKEIEENYSDLFTVTASAPMSGPYSVSEEMVNFTLGDQPYETVSYLAWIVLAYQVAYPELLKDYALEDIFKPEYIQDIEDFRDEIIFREELNVKLRSTLLSTVGTVTPKDMLHDSIVDALRNDPMHPLSRALQDNDVYDWTPQAPMRMYYCEGDEQVVYTNAVLADSVMNARGAVDVEAVQNDPFSPLTHGGCVLPASFSATVFFQGFQNILTSSEELTFDPNVTINNNNEYLWIKTPLSYGSNMLTLSIYDISGVLLMHTSIQSGQTLIELNTLSKGMFVVHIRDVQRIIKSKKIVRF